MKSRIILPIAFCLITANLSLKAQSYTDYIDSSFIYIEAGNLTKAENALLKALRTEPANPGNVLLLSNLGTIQRNLGKLPEALQSYNNALVMSPKSLTLLNNRAALWAEMDSLQRAKDDYSSILFIDEKNEESLYRRGLIFLGLRATPFSQYKKRQRPHRTRSLNEMQRILFSSHRSLYAGHTLQSQYGFPIPQPCRSILLQPAIQSCRRRHRYSIAADPRRSVGICYERQAETGTIRKRRCPERF